MDYNEYEIDILPAVRKRLFAIKNLYKINKKISEESSKKIVSDIVAGFDILKIFPDAGIDFDERCGRKINDKIKTRAIVLKHKYIALYYVDEKNRRVNVSHLFSTRENYMKLFK